MKYIEISLVFNKVFKLLTKLVIRTITFLKLK